MVLTNPQYVLVQGRALSQEDIMQSFPIKWETEFPLISNLGFGGIEWIYDKKSENFNPILTKEGRKKMNELSEKFNVRLENIVFDWFMVHPLLINDEFTVYQKIEKFIQLIDFSVNAGFKRIILPLLEKNDLSTNEKIIQFKEIVIEKFLPIIESRNIELHLETSLSPKDEYMLIKEINSNKVRICYDMGNSVSFGYSPDLLNEIKDFLGTVHIKDRILHGASIPLGEGDVKFQRVFKILNNIQFEGPYCFQIYRNNKSNNLQVLKESRKFINNIMSKINHE